MSVAKPVVEYAKSIKIRTDLGSSVQAFKRLLQYSKPYLMYFIVIVVLTLTKSYLFTIEPLVTSKIIDDVILHGKQDLLLGYLTTILLSVFAYGALSWIALYINGYAAQKMIRDIRSEYYSSLQEKSFGFYDSSNIGDLCSRATVDLQAVDMFLRTWIANSAEMVFTVTAIFIQMYSVNPLMSLVAMLPMPFIFFFNFKLYTQTMPLFRKMQMIMGRLSAYVQQNIIGMKNVRIFNREEEMEKGFEDVEKIFVDTAISAGRIQSIYMPSAPTILTLGATLVYLVGANLIVAPTAMLTIGQLTLFTRYMTRMSMPLRNITMLIGTWINASAGLERVFYIMDRPVEVYDMPNASDHKITRGEVEFRDVTFGYAEDKPVLKDLNFTVKPGEKIAILGATGSGKSSLIYLIPRFYDVQKGSVLIDGVDVKDFKLASLRRQMGMVFQDVFLFSGTIASNIAFGRPDASTEEIENAAKLSRIHDFITELPEGYDTPVGERGVTLSGGQKQRLTIARALVTNPKILILDDSLSFVDAKTEQEIQAAIDEATKGRTTFIIAQRLSTIKNADRIIVLDNGVVIEIGTHNELMARGAIYRRIYETQFLDKAPEKLLGVVS